ncbi:GWxTD domain-containing protein [Acidobacteria bacterium AH-259-G07]|nr:GWxTD domain-containing protein [Acidobacteria bacterium AH-259-G07]
MWVRHASFWLALFLSVAMPLLYSADKRDLSDKHRRWLEEEVVYIIGEQERKEFLTLPSELDLEEFIERFWALRDPDPSTEESEYRLEHYRRIRLANQRFHEGRPGWKTDRGRIYIMHGPPDDITFTFGGNPLRVSIQNPTEVITGGNPDKRRSYPMELVRPETEIWVYRHLEGARSFPGYFEVMFSRIDPGQLHMLHLTIKKVGARKNQSYAARVARDTAIMSFLRGQRLGGEYRILYAGQYRFPDIDDFYQSIFHPSRLPSFSITDLQMALRDLERSPGEVLQERWVRERRLKEAVKSRVFFEQFYPGLFFGLIRSRSGATLIPITLGISSEHEGDILEVLLELVRADGSSAASVVDSLKIGGSGKSSRASGDGEEFVYQTRLSARPGHYKLLVYARLKNRGAMAYLERDIQAPDYSGPDLAMSEVLLFDEVISRKNFEQLKKTTSIGRFLGSSSPLYLKDYVLMPATDSRFRRREKLTAFFEVYNPGIAQGTEEPALDLKCRIWRENKLVASIPEKLLDYVAESKLKDQKVRQTAYGLSIPLRTLHPGDYFLELEVYDRVLKHNVSTRRPFTVY